jgi:hypothetical protein
MTTTEFSPAAPPRDVRASYEEYDLQGTRVAMIADPANEHAWIQSDVTAPVER